MSLTYFISFIFSSNFLKKSSSLADNSLKNFLFSRSYINGIKFNIKENNQPLVILNKKNTTNKLKVEKYKAM